MAESRPVGRPTFSIVSAVHDVAPYLPEFIESIETQRFDLARVEVIAVDDGSTDGSLAILEDWARRRPGLVTILAQPNAGQGAARNLGLGRATGEWVTFTDPDDRLGSGALQVAADFARAHLDIAVMAARPVLLDETRDRITDDHPRRRQYDRGDRVVDLDEEPNAFPGSSTVSFFRLDVVRATGRRFDERIRPNFEDGDFMVRFLLDLPKPRAGFLRDAVYVYRKRAASTSTLQGSWADPRRYTDVLEHGYLGALEAARERIGRVPPWLQQVVVYELSWYLAENDKVSSAMRVPPAAVPRFHELMARITALLDPAVIRTHAVRPLKSAWIDTLARAYRGIDWHSELAVRGKVDRAMALQRVQHRWGGAAPAVRYLVDGRPREPVYAKTMAHTLAQRTIFHERVAWLPLGRSLEVELGGRSVPIIGRWPDPGAEAGLEDLRRGILVARSLPVRDAVAGIARRAWRMALRVAAVPLRAVAASRPVRRRFGRAWVVMDRIHEAGDNGERLFEHLRAERADINAWFVLERGTRDWQRLRAAGVDRLVAFGSLRWVLLMLNADWVLSSHVDLPILLPGAIRWMVPQPTWRFGFLQHGVIKDDLSLWLNRKNVDLFVVSTQAELDSVVRDGSGYLYTTKETRNTGLPRFDRLLAMGRSVRDADRDLVLVCPTWRGWLMAPNEPWERRRTVAESVWESRFLRDWLALLGSTTIAEAARRNGRRIGFMPHPNFQQLLPDLTLPPHVEAIRFADHDAQSLYARSALVVTDYSSVAFNAAVIERPVVYFQFDRAEMLGGSHVGRAGYFEYERDGFGPVAEDLAAAEAAVVAALDAGPRTQRPYLDRIEAAFPVRDGRACARVVEALESMAGPTWA